MRTSLIAAAVALSAFAGAASAQSTTYVIDPSHTFPKFSYNHLGLSTQQSRFNTTTGSVTMDKAAKTASVDVVIDMKAVDTGSTAFNGHIQGEDFLDTAKFPTASFKSTKVVFEGDKPAAVEGNLTIKGITKPVTLKLTNFVSTLHPMNKKEVIGANATTTIKRSEFNAGKFAPAVGDEVTITIALEAIKQ
jgi:polyisoprenoid-binding protein YceI